MTTVRHRVSLLVICAFLAACGGATQPDPDAGHIRFGRSVDMTTFALSGQASSFPSGQDVAFRAAMPRVMTSSSIRLVGTLNGVEIINQTAEVNESEWTVYVGTIPSAYLFEAGTFEMRIVDVGNNQLASGSFTVR